MSVFQCKTDIESKGCYKFGRYKDRMVQLSNSVVPMSDHNLRAITSVMQGLQFYE